MRRITLWLLSTIAALVLLFSYRTSTMGAATASVATSSLGEGGGTAGGDGTTYKGTVAQTRWGPVQVRITVSGNKITNVAVPTYPNSNGRDRQINAYALPILTQETLAAQSADIDSVSGATVTSEGYKQSLQAAITAAHLS
jgi:uncharacterized protein with FMN-binding domain